MTDDEVIALSQRHADRADPAKWVCIPCRAELSRLIADAVKEALTVAARRDREDCEYE